MAKKKAIGSNPLDLVLGGVADEEVAETETAPASEPVISEKSTEQPEQPTPTEIPRRKRATDRSAKEAKRATERMTVHLPVELHEELRDAAVYLGFTLTEIMAGAAERELKKLRKGAAVARFPSRSREPRRGRPIS